MDANIIIIQNAKSHLEDIEKRMKEMRSWGKSWENSSFYTDLINQKCNWIRWKKEAERAIELHRL